MPWTAPPRSARAWAALDAIAAGPPGPPPDAQRRGRRWYVPRPVADVVAAYHAAGAPVPAGAGVTTVDPAGTVLTVTALGRTSGIFLRPEPDGCSLVITDGPSLTVTGSDTAADGDHFVRVGTVPYDSDPHGSGFFAVLDLPGGPWWVLAGTSEDDHVSRSLCLLGAPRLFQDSDERPAGVLRSADGLGGDADLTVDPDGVVSAAIRDTTAVVVARRTDDVALAAHTLGMDAPPTPPDPPTAPDDDTAGP